MKNKKLALAKSLLALLLCVAMLVSTTFAWFTDSVVSGINTIAAGNLDVELYHSNAAVTNQKVTANTQLFLDLQGNPILWEPGVVSYENLRVTNEGDLALIYQMAINTANENYILDNGAQYGLSQVLKVGVVEGGITATDRDGVVASVNSWTTLKNFLCSGSLLADGEKTWGVVIYWQPGDNDNNWNANNGKQLSSGDALSIDLGIKLTATQEMYENDSFGNDYDVSAKDDAFPSFGGGSASTPIEVGADNRTTAAVTIAIGDITATIPAGVLVEEGIDKLTLTVKTLSTTSANVVLGEDEAIRSLDVHVEGVSANNDTPITVTLPEVAPVALNMGNYNVYHVENGATNEMTLVASNGDFDAHNQYKYDPATGDVVLYMATFSEVAVVAETENAWEGNFDYTWYDANKTELTISNADQLAAFGAIVGGMKKVTGRVDNKYSYSDEVIWDSFKGKTIKLIADINLADDEDHNNPDIIFYPIGYYNSDKVYEKTLGTPISSYVNSFEGTFDGNGHTIANFYHNTWEMKGDHDWYTNNEQYYRDGMGLFGRVYGGTVKNLTVDNFSCDGEIATTGVIAAYAEGATFENIAITNCNPRVYNIGNGGIVGCVGWYAKEEGLKTTFKNITVDNTNKISALWGSYDVACGGILGQYYPTSGQTSANKPANGGVHFENCHVSAQMDVYNDVCANYQYYAYRYTGMLIGSVRENVTIDGHSYPKMDGITAKDCTVHFGTWNDYYYCEIIDNTTASYTHDYQMSRLEQVASVDVANMTVTSLKGETTAIPNSGRVNYVVVNVKDAYGNFVHGTENATCYHFKDGAVWTHDMGGIQTGIDENGDGQDDLKEDKQHIYLEFNNLVTGYGWGVTSKGVDDVDGVEILDNLDGTSYEKFESNVTELKNNLTYKFGDIFTYKKNIKLVPGALAVSVTSLDENNPISATIVYDRDNWENGTITLTGTGAITITIQDYYFCKPTTIEVNIVGRQLEKKFDVVMNNGDFLHRVGSQNAVALSYLFSTKHQITKDIEVTFENVEGNAYGKYTSNTTWNKGSIQFSGTGVVKVTITDNDYCIATELYLEVIDATNLTSATGTTTGGNFVLLCDVNTSTYVNYYNSTLYGNGFTYSLSGAPTAYNSKQGHGILLANSATFDNVVIIGDVYGSYGAYTNQDYYNAAIQATDTIIQNCYVANCSTPVRGNNVTIINSTLYGGTVANLILSSGTNTLKDVTTVNYNDDRNVIGLGIVVNDEASDNTKIVIEGSLKQYNYVCKSDSSKVPGTDAKKLFNSMFTDTFNAYKVGEYVNTGIIIMSEALSTDIITGSVTGYEKLDDAELQFNVYGVTKTVKGAVYAPKGAGATVDNSYDYENDAHVATKQGAYLPTFEFDLGNYFDANDGETDTRYCYESINNETVRLLYQDGKDPFTFDLTKLASVTKFGYALNTTVTCKNASGTVLATNSSVTLKDAGMYTFEITVNDDIIYGADGKRTGESVSRTYVVNVELSVKKASWKNAEISLTSPSQKSGYNSSKYYVLNFLAAISIIDYAEDGTKETVDLKADYDSYEITYVDTSSGAWKGFTLTINYKDGRVLTVTFGAPDGLSSPGSSAGGKTISLKTDKTYGYLLQSDGKINTKVSGTWPITKCTFKGANTVTVENTTAVNITVDKSITINVSSGSSSGTCIAEGSMITMADGSKKAVEDVRRGDLVMAFDHATGKVVYKEVALVGKTYAESYYKSVFVFSDGTELMAINEHGIYDLDLNQYVNIGHDNYQEYIGHKFVSIDTNGNIGVKYLVDVVSTVESGYKYDIVTNETLTYVVEDTLSVSHEIVMILNSFTFGDNMTYDAEAMQADIEKYGLYTYEDFAEYCDRETFEKYNMAMMKVGVGKGMYTHERIVYLLTEIALNDNVQII